MEEALFIKEMNNRVFIRAQGHITANSCPELKARVFDRLEAKPAVEEVNIDMSDCEYMDSTFMGLIVGFNKRFLRFSPQPVKLFGLNETCLKLLKTIGVARLVTIGDEPPRFPEPLERLGPGRKAEAGLVLKAHEELMKLSDENEKRFSALHSALKKATADDSE
ncbi:MAG: STAS domain-containing protein [Spirochaetales bacterium]|nr:STAS domain-containing protein [Spirochaetales bacterium]